MISDDPIGKRGTAYMNESRGDEYTSTKVLAEEEDLGRDAQPLDLLCYHRETGACSTGKEDND